MEIKEIKLDGDCTPEPQKIEREREEISRRIEEFKKLTEIARLKAKK